MNVLIDAHVFDEPHQGTRTYLKGLYREVIKLMPTSTFFFAAYNTERIKLEIGDHANVFFVAYRQKKVRRILFEIPSIVRTHKIDYVHFQYVSSPVKNCRHIVTTHDILFKDFPQFFPLKYRIVKDFLFRISARRADFLFTVSDYSKERISSHYHIRPKSIGITPNGISEEFLTDYARAPELNDKYNLGSFILYVSRVEPRKNHLALLKAYCELKLWERNYKLVFIGRKDLRYAEFEDFLTVLPEKYRENIMHIPEMENDELLIFYRNASLFVYPSLAEGFGIPPLEAIATGTDTLCSNRTAMSEYTFLGDDLFNPEDLEELKSKILKKLACPNDLERKRLLKQHIMEKYSWSNSAMEFVSSIRNAHHNA